MSRPTREPEKPTATPIAAQDTGADDDPVAAWRALLLAQHRVLRAIERDLERARMIPLTWYDVLLELRAVEGGCLRMNELSERVVLSRSRVSRLVADMRTRGS